MTTHTHWGVKYLTNSSGRKKGWHLCLQSIRHTRSAALQAALDHYLSPGPDDARWEAWHAVRNAGELRAVKLTITEPQ